ncbi:hypothetical protein L6R53_19475 [Myxococcota bacterium]|nr:hypothetical protein [Myxococcota bacterium]
MLSTLLLAGCWSIPLEVQLTGTLLEARDGQGLAGADIAIHDALDVPGATGTTGEGGAFEITVPASQSFFVTFTDEAGGHLPTSFTGLAGSSDVEAEEGTLFLRSVDELALLRAEFAACPQVATEGPVVEGEVRLWLDVEEVDELPTVPDATVVVHDADDNQFAACYLDDKGASLPDGTRTGATGRFAVFGVPEGPLSVAVTWAFAEGVDLTSWYIVRAAPGGVVPMYPAWVEGP